MIKAEVGQVFEEESVSVWQGPMELSLEAVCRDAQHAFCLAAAMASRPLNLRV